MHSKIPQSLEDARFLGTQVRDDGSGPLVVSHQLGLTVVEGADRGIQVKLSGVRLAIGTANSGDLVLSDQTVSRRHCEILVRNEQYLLRDLGSTNGTLLNGTPVVEAYLTPGSVIQVGATQVLFEPTKKWERVAEPASDRFGDMFGASRPMREVFGMLGRIASTDLSCLIMGETGTGKELAARALHSHGSRADKAFVVVDCGAMSATLTESELFGHEKGAFTGADRMRPGAFELADGGTIFLDEVGELPIHLQPKLLRALERREVKRLGASRPVDVDVRVIAATHRNLGGMIDSKDFREDLYYRLAEVVIALPPLRERREDIALIAERMLRSLTPTGKPALSLSAEAIHELKGRPWLGNVRELRNTIKRAAALAQSASIDTHSLGARQVRGSTLTGMLPSPAASYAGDDAPPTLNEALPIKEARELWVAHMEKAYLKQVIQRFSGDLDAAAAHAGVHRKSLERLLRQHQLKLQDLLAEEDAPGLGDT